MLTVHSDQKVDQDLFVNTLYEYWSTSEFPKEIFYSMSIFSRIQKALIRLFENPHSKLQVSLPTLILRWSHNQSCLWPFRGLIAKHHIHYRDKDAIRKTLPQWDELFRETFAKCVRIPEFDIWDFITPNIGNNAIVNILDAHLSIRRIIAKPLEVELDKAEVQARIANGCVVPDGTAPEGQGPIGTATTSTADPHYYHVCPYCTSRDTNRREDALSDHMARIHHVYRDTDYFLKNCRNNAHLRRMKVSVLMTVIKKERAMLNALRAHLRAVKCTLATIEKKAPAANTDPVMDVEGEDLYVLKKDPVTKQMTLRVPKNKVQLAKILEKEREVYITRDLEKETRRNMRRAWKKATKHGRGLYDWTAI